MAAGGSPAREEIMKVRYSVKYQGLPYQEHMDYFGVAEVSYNGVRYELCTDTPQPTDKAAIEDAQNMIQKRFYA